MKTITLSLVVICMLSGISYAGKDVAIAEVIPVAVEPSMDRGLYVGIGASKMSLRNNLSEEEFGSVGVMLQLGYQLTDYLAIEGRYTKGVGDLEYDHGITVNPD